MEAIKRKEIIFCECGCGKTIPQYDDRHRERRFIQGHNAGKNKKRKERVLVICDYCGSEYEKLPCQLKFKHHFCSDHCRAKWIGANPTQELDYRIKMRNIALKNGNKPPLLIRENHPNWKGGISEYNRGADWEYCKWRKNVLAKDNYTCVICGIRGGNLSAHHIKGWAKYPELRYDVNNGQCMHYDCHMTLHGLNKKTV